VLSNLYNFSTVGRLDNSPSAIWIGFACVRTHTAKDARNLMLFQFRLREIMKRFIALITLIGMSAIANADAISFNVDAGDNVGIGSIFTDSSGFATSGSLDMTSGSITGIYSLFSGGGSPTYSPKGAFIYDNMTFSGTAAVNLNYWGLLFVGKGLEINIWGNGAGNPYSFWSYNGSSYNVSSNAATFSIVAPAASPAAVPVPSTVWLFGSALIAGLLFEGTGRHKQAPVFAA